MRRWEQGLPLPSLPALGGRPIAIWLDRFVLCHRRTVAGWCRAAWPDGQPLLRQSWTEAAVDRIIAHELATVAAEHARHRATRTERRNR